MWSRNFRHSRISAVWFGLLCAIGASGQLRPIDTSKSNLTVHVYKAGMLSAFGHDHEITAPVAEGSADVQARKVELRVRSEALKVRDAKASDKDRAEIQTTMAGPDVLNVATYKEISFRSTSAESAGAGVWKVIGELALHGQTHTVSMDVHETEGRYTGSCRFNLSGFGIKPVKAVGGAVRVKDEVQVDFDIQFAR